jgi:hypothetical protein
VKKNLVPQVLLAMCVASGTPAAQASNPKVVQGSGCIEKAVENSCRVVIDSKTGELYNLLFSDRTPKPGTAIKFAGVQQHGATACTQGKPVKVSKWKKEKGIKCPPPVIAQVGR